VLAVKVEPLRAAPALGLQVALLSESRRVGRYSSAT
jgi:hypothetical protein